MHKTYGRFVDRYAGGLLAGCVALQALVSCGLFVWR